jgi:predicted amidohydrolase
MTINRRPVRLATVSHRPAHGCDTPQNTDRLLASVAQLIERAARMGADLVAFPEFYPQLATSDPYHHAEPSDGGTLGRVRELARTHRLIVVWPRIEYDPEHGLRNASILVDRQGEVAGRYFKMFPTVGELEKGIIPGTEAAIFDTDFGRVGLLICFDMNFPEVRDALGCGKPDVVVFSSMYRGSLQAQALAYESRAFVVTSVPTELGLIIDRCGRVLKESTYETLAVAPVNTNSIALHMDFNWPKMDAMLAKYGRALSFDYHTREAFFVITYDGPQPIDELVKEFALEPADDYYARSRRAREAALFRWSSRTTG